jgi:hypothetical protein
MSDSDKVEIMTVAGVEGTCIYIDKYRVSGPKPWGGGKTKDVFLVNKSEIYKALGIKQ